MKYAFPLTLMFLASCTGEVQKPDFFYTAEFDTRLIDGVEEYFKSLAIEKTLMSSKKITER